MIFREVSRIGGDFCLSGWQTRILLVTNLIHDRFSLFRTFEKMRSVRDAFAIISEELWNVNWFFGRAWIFGLWHLSSNADLQDLIQCVLHVFWHTLMIQIRHFKMSERRTLKLINSCTLFRTSLPSAKSRKAVKRSLKILKRAKINLLHVTC